MQSFDKYRAMAVLFWRYRFVLQMIELCIGLFALVLKGGLWTMTETKYGKYIITRPKQEALERVPWSDAVAVSMFVDEEVVEGAYYLMGAWFYKVTGRGSPPEEHTHDFDEYLGFLGTNPDDPYDLGGEVELWLGGEKHILTESCAVFVPAGLAHAPIYFRRVDRPIWYFATGPTQKYAKDIKK